MKDDTCTATAHFGHQWLCDIFSSSLIEAMSQAMEIIDWCITMKKRRDGDKLGRAVRGREDSVAFRRAEK